MAPDSLGPVRIQFDAREASAAVSVHVQVTHMGWVRLGLWLIRLGCRIGGFGFVDEFPISLVQPAAPALKDDDRGS